MVRPKEIDHAGMHDIGCMCILIRGIIFIVTQHCALANLELIFTIIGLVCVFIKMFKILDHFIQQIQHAQCMGYSTTGRAADILSIIII